MNNYADYDKSILSIANDFYNAYKRCREERNQHIDDYGRMCSEVINVPALVNGAFACELYIKSYLPKNAWGHELKVLFYNLPEEKRRQINEKTSFKLKTTIMDFDFNYYLSKFSNAFKFWRYIYEKKSLGSLGLNHSLQFLDVFIEVIKEELSQ